MRREAEMKSSPLSSVKSLFSCFAVLFLVNAYLFKTFFFQEKEEPESLEVFLNRVLSLDKKSTCQSSITTTGKFYYWVLKNFICRAIALVWLREVRGKENIPKEEPFLLILNHQSYLDFLLVTFAFRKSKTLTFFIKGRYFDKAFWKFFLVPMGQIKADRRAIPRSIVILKDEKKPVVLFAEGTRTRNGELGELNKSFVVIAKRIPHLKIIPVGISGAFEIWPASKKFPKIEGGVKISIGKALSFSECGYDKDLFFQNIKGEIEELVAK